MRVKPIQWLSLNISTVTQKMATSLGTDQPIAGLSLSGLSLSLFICLCVIVVYMLYAYIFLSGFSWFLGCLVINYKSYTQTWENFKIGWAV